MSQKCVFQIAATRAESAVCVCVALKRPLCAERAVEEKNMGEVPPLSPQTMGHEQSHPTGDLVLGLQSSCPWGFLPESSVVPWDGPR